MTQVRTFWLALSYVGFLATLVVARPIDPNNPPAGRFLDEWAEVYIAGGKVGYAHSTMTREGDVIHTKTTTKMRIGRVDQPVTIETVQGTTETISGLPISFASDMNASLMKTSMNGTVKNGRVTIVNSQYGMQQTQTFDFAKGALMTWGQHRASIRRGFKPGTEYSLQVYVPELRLDGPVDATTKIGDREEFEHRGKHLVGQRVTLLLTTPIGSMELISWIGDDGWPLKAKIPAPGLGDLVLVATDQATALADFIPPEIFMTTVIKAKRKIDPKSASRIKYHIRSIKGDVDLSEFPTTGMQTVATRADGSVDLLVTRQRHKAGEPRASARADSGPEPRASVRAIPVPPRLRSEDLAEYLQPNLMINTDDPRLIALARRAGRGETDPYVLADKLRRFVTDYVETKSLSIGFATASEVCRTREGDCSEHGVLLAALGRLNKLPSRVAVGMAYVRSFGGRDDIFGYHLWTQFYIDGRWVDFDAALKESVCSPTRIAFATSSLRNTGLADLSLPLLSKIGAIDIDILDVETNRGLQD